jgi:hypothetical protein
MLDLSKCTISGLENDIVKDLTHLAGQIIIICCRFQLVGRMTVQILF